ncbi:MAG: hypothetical protein HY428_01445 [Candidatus Levybacteria bacterium]|nr:hypothetical protein [Candidatus Levybacteria bacterium]
MAKKAVRRTTAKVGSSNKTMTIIAFWIIALLTAFLLLGSVARPLLWVFVLGAFLSYYTLRKR